MRPFQGYSNYYDLLYQEKDYKKECDFLEEIFEKYSDFPVKNILDLGCGTGGHVLILAARGYRLTGVDFSPKMLEIAKRKAKKKIKNLEFVLRDIKEINLQKKFDAIISMFAVISYLTENEDILSTFKRAKSHLKKGGIFTFDCWFGPAVLCQKPEKREKNIKDGKEEIKRVASPILDVLKKTVDVNFQLLKTRGEKVLEKVKETHKMRFFFPQEINYYLKKTGFKVLKISPFMELDKEPTEEDWNITVIAKKI